MTQAAQVRLAALALALVLALTLGTLGTLAGRGVARLRPAVEAAEGVDGQLDAVLSEARALAEALDAAGLGFYHAGALRISLRLAEEAPSRQDRLASLASLVALLPKAVELLPEPTSPAQREALGQEARRLERELERSTRAWTAARVAWRDAADTLGGRVALRLRLVASPDGLDVDDD